MKRGRRMTFLMMLCVASFIVIVRIKMKENSLITSSSLLSSLINENNIESSSISLKEIIKFLNNEQKIFNAERFGSVTNETILITVQVHNRITYLKHLIDSLRLAKDIDKALIIFSHDIYNSSINELVRGIDFCRVMQIFFPYSIQLYPDEFPGSDPRDCDRDIGRAAAMRKGCLNARNDDTYGHYREAKFSQMKHHWWWKLNRIFDELRVTRYQKGFLLLLEEDYYVAPDFLHIYLLMQQTVPEKCPQCNLLSLGTYYDSIRAHNVLDFFAWDTSKHNMAMALNKSTWSEVRKCGSHFCNYDEYNYDFSFQNVNRRCLKNHFFVALMQGPPRMFHVGECGIHHSKSDCDVEAKINEINERLDHAWRDNLLYPEKLNVVHHGVLYNPSTPLVNNGGWADRRDQCLCNSVINTDGREVDLQKCRDFYEKPIVTRSRRV